MAARLLLQARYQSVDAAALAIDGGDEVVSQFEGQ
jgi:hypothetical protein